MTGRAHPGVDAYLAQLPAWQRSICEQLRELVWETDAEIEETIKRTVQPYFVLQATRPPGRSRSTRATRSTASRSSASSPRSSTTTAGAVGAG